MDSATREARTSAAFVSLTDTLVSDFDLVELMHTLIDACIDLMDTDAGGLLLADANGDLQLMASSVEDVDVVEVVQLAAEAGPCWECFTTGQAITLGDIATDGGRWPEFQRSALEKGYRSVHATPMRLHGQTIGTMNLFHSKVGALNDRDIALAQALTDVATIAILQERGTRQLRDLSTQLQRALDSRIVVEQAKGLIAQSLNVSMDEAFAVLRNHARSANQSLQTVARAVTERRLVLTAHHHAAALGDDATRKRHAAHQSRTQR
jgi:GAF domain-containing protein